MWFLWQDKPSRREMLARGRRASQAQAHQTRGHVGQRSWLQSLKTPLQTSIIQFPIFIQQGWFKKLASPRLQYNHLVFVRQYIKPDPPTKNFHDYQQQLMGYPSVVLQQQMEKAIIITSKNTHLFQKPFPVWDPDFTSTFTTRFSPIPFVDDYNLTYIVQDYGIDPFWDTELYKQDLLQFQYVLGDIDHYHKTVHENPPLTHNKKIRALIENWQMNGGTNTPVFPNHFGTENTENSCESIAQSLLD